jgi:hypothetical protein
MEQIIMSRPIIRIHNVETGEIIDREMNNQELAQWEKDLADIEATKAAKAAKAAAKAQAEAKLEALGLTPDDLKALGL